MDPNNSPYHLARLLVGLAPDVKAYELRNLFEDLLLKFNAEKDTVRYIEL